MKWRGRGGAGRIEDRRGSGGGLGGGGLPIPMGKVGGGGIGTILIVLLFLLPLLARRRRPRRRPRHGPVRRRRPAHRRPTWTRRPADDPAKFVDFVAGRRRRDLAEDLRRERQDLRAPRRSSSTTTACSRPAATRRRRSGRSTARATARSISISSFMEQLQQQLGAPGDFAQAYIVAHEIGHHVQNLLGVMEDVDLRAAGEPGRRERALGAGRAAGRLPGRGLGALGLSRRATCSRAATSRKGSTPLRRSATTGSRSRRARASIPTRSRTARSEQRVKWFRAGFDSGDPTACDTFKGDV